VEALRCCPSSVSAHIYHFCSPTAAAAIASVFEALDSSVGSLGIFCRTVVFFAAVLAAPKARAVRTPDLASIFAERVSALETAGLVCRGGC
jgi:hypothetical protein